MDIDQIKQNLENFYRDGHGTELEPKSQYLLEKIETIEDLYQFLLFEEQISLWSSLDLFCFMICLITGEDSDFDRNKPSSDSFRQALDNVRVTDPDIFGGHD